MTKKRDLFSFLCGVFVLDLIWHVLLLLTSQTVIFAGIVFGQGVNLGFVIGNLVLVSVFAVLWSKAEK